MGQRADNFAHAFDGYGLDWDQVLGSGFRDAPRSWASVYRECSIDELVRIGRDGLAAPTPHARHPDIRQEMELLDSFRPPHVVRRGVSRLAAIYASPTPETPRLPFRKERVIVEMRVDPSASSVGDMDFITALIPFMGARKFGLEKYHGAFRKYWESVISLRDFTRHYRSAESAAGSQWFRSRSAPAALPKMFFAPEVMVMTPNVSRRHIRIVRHEAASDEFAGQHDERIDSFGEYR